MIQTEQLLFCSAVNLLSDKLDRTLSSLTNKQQIRKKIGVIMRIFGRAYSLEAGAMQALLLSVSYIITYTTVFLQR